MSAAASRRVVVPPEVAQRAVEWWVELGSGRATDATHAGLARWRAEDPLHDAAWRHIEAVNGRFARLAGVSGADAARAALLTPTPARRRAALKSLAVLLGVGGAAWMTERSTPWQTWRADLRTAVGERRTVTLADRTVITLNTDSALNLRFDTATRTVQLVRGEVMVTSGHDPQAPARPFLVVTAQGALQPVGTRFAVRAQGEATRLEVFEGAVRATPHDAPGLARVIDAGHSTQFTRDRLAAPQALADDAAAWVDGMLVAAGMRLADLLAELDRYRPGRLDCDPAVADLRVSGTYPLDDTDRILATLRATLPIEVASFTRYWVRVVPARSGVS
jgi:transmembrane sensor